MAVQYLVMWTYHAQAMYFFLPTFLRLHFQFPTQGFVFGPNSLIGPPAAYGCLVT